jgi:hypothetical protein
LPSSSKAPHEMTGTSEERPVEIRCRETEQ